VSFLEDQEAMVTLSVGEGGVASSTVCIDGIAGFGGETGGSIAGSVSCILPLMTSIL
jgi:hypothetical protein